MESKIQRIEKILKQHCIDVQSFNIDGKEYSIDNSTNPLTNAMLQLYEEVEYNTGQEVRQNILKEFNLFTKKQVEELLAKQRELCAENITIWQSSSNDINDVKEDILNAKLIIEKL